MPDIEKQGVLAEVGARTFGTLREGLDVASVIQGKLNSVYTRPRAQPELGKPEEPKTFHDKMLLNERLAGELLNELREIRERLNEIF